MNSTMPVAWIFILLLILVVFGALAAIIWRSWIAGAVVLVFIVLVFGLYFLRVNADPSPPNMVILHEAAVPPTPVEQWEPDPELMKTADVYPSMDEGVKNLAGRLCDTIQFSPQPVSVQRIHIIAAKLDKNAQIVTDVFKDTFPAATVVTNNEHTSEPGELTVTVGIVDSGKTDKSLKFTARQEQRNFGPVEARVVETPWIVNFEEYRATNKKGDWHIGRSSRPETSRDRALQQAREDAARQLMPFVQNRIVQLNSPNVTPQWLHSRLVQEMALGRLGKEQFSQRFTLTASTEKVYRAAILVDHSSNAIDGLRNSVLQASFRQNDRIRRFGIGTVGMGFLICLVYLFLNWATRGYFQMNLRLGAFLVLIAGVLLLLMIG